MPLVEVDCFVMRLPAADTREPEQLAQALAQDSRVAWTQAVHVYKAHAEVREPVPALLAAQPATRQWRLADLHELATGRGVRVAVIDSGIEAEHPDLAGQVVVNENFVDGRAMAGERHGTAVAGIIAARSGKAQGISGVAPQARLLGLRACWQEGIAANAETACTSLSLAKALHAAIDKQAQVINMSLAGPDDRLLALLLDQALSRGIAVVAPWAPGPGGFPASHPGVLAVSNLAQAPAGILLAPGRDVPASAPGGGWAVVNGASFSAAHVSGLVALMRELEKSGSLTRAALVTSPGGSIDTCATLLRRAPARRFACAQPMALGLNSE